MKCHNGHNMWQLSQVGHSHSHIITWFKKKNVKDSEINNVILYGYYRLILRMLSIVHT